MLRRWLMVVALLLAVAWAAPIRAGSFRSVLFDAFCGNLARTEMIGCSGYLQYRIKDGRDRNESLKLCAWGCARVLDNSTAVERCRNGCLFTRQQDH